MVSEQQTASSTDLSTPSQLSLAQVPEYLQCQLIRQLHIKERNLVDFILERKNEKIIGEAGLTQFDSRRSYHGAEKGWCVLSATTAP